MRLFLATAVLCASSALAQFSNEQDYDYDDGLEARDAVWEAAHGGKAPSYHGFEEMAQGYPGHPMKSYGAEHHARDVEDEYDLGDEEGFIDNAASFANNVARSMKGAYDHMGHKVDEAVKHAKAKAGYDEQDWRQFKKGDSWNRRDVEDSGDDYELSDDELSSIFARDAEDDFDYAQDIDWNPETRYDDEDGSQLAERDVDEDDDGVSAFDDDDEEVEDPKLQLEQEFDEGLDERDEGGLLERSAEAFNFFGFGSKNDHRGMDDAEHKAYKKGMKHVFARDGGLSPEDEDLDGAYDPISDDPSLSDEEFYGEAETEALERRSMPQYDDDDDEDEDDVTSHKGDHTRTKKPSGTKTGSHTKSGSHIKTGSHTKTGTKAKTSMKTGVKTKSSSTMHKHQATETAHPTWGGWFPW